MKRSAPLDPPGAARALGLGVSRALQQVLPHEPVQVAIEHWRHGYSVLERPDVLQEDKA